MQLSLLSLISYPGPQLGMQAVAAFLMFGAKFSGHWRHLVLELTSPLKVPRPHFISQSPLVLLYSFPDSQRLVHCLLSVAPSSAVVLFLEQFLHIVGPMSGLYDPSGHRTHAVELLLGCWPGGQFKKQSLILVRPFFAVVML